MIHFDKKQVNNLLLNPRLPENEKNVLQELANFFSQQISPDGYFLIASSGSSRQVGQSIKLVALPVEAVLHSASRFNTYFEATREDNWGLVLPEFHVAGLGVCARAYLAQSHVFKTDWDVTRIYDWIIHNKIAFMSLVPAQAFDLMQNTIQCPKSIKKILVGAGTLSFDLRQRLADLNWPIVETYGMTETSSMIALRENADLFTVMPGVEVATVDGMLKIVCDSLLTATVQKNLDQIDLFDYRSQNFYQTQDRVELFVKPGQTQLKFLGREHEYVKILGEGVSLPELKSRFEKLFLQEKVGLAAFELLAISDERSEHKLVLVVEEDVSEEVVQRAVQLYHQNSRAYERIKQVFRLPKIPRTDLGKLKLNELKSIIKF